MIEFDSIIKKMFLAGAKDAEIGRLVGRTPEAVKQYRHRIGLMRRKNGINRGKPLLGEIEETEDFIVAKARKASTEHLQDLMRAHARPWPSLCERERSHGLLNAARLLAQAPSTSSSPYTSQAALCEAN